MCDVVVTDSDLFFKLQSLPPDARDELLGLIGKINARSPAHEELLRRIMENEDEQSTPM